MNGRTFQSADEVTWEVVCSQRETLIYSARDPLWEGGREGRRDEGGEGATDMQKSDGVLRQWRERVGRRRKGLRFRRSSLDAQKKDE